MCDQHFSGSIGQFWATVLAFKMFLNVLDNMFTCA